MFLSRIFLCDKHFKSSKSNISAKIGGNVYHNWYVSKTTDAPTEIDPIVPSDLKGSETILIVEDNAQVRDISREILKRRGYTVLIAENGKEALTILKQQKEPVDLILSDVVMPEMDGKNLLDRMAVYYPGVKVLFMSGYTDDVIAHRGVLYEDANFIQKPFTAYALSIKVREILEDQN